MAVLGAAHWTAVIVLSLVYTTTPVSVFHSQASGGVARTNMHDHLVVDDRLKITSVFTGYPGCTQDACVLKNSALFDECESGQVTLLPGGYVIADTAYPVKMWLIYIYNIVLI